MVEHSYKGIPYRKEKSGTQKNLVGVQTLRLGVVSVVPVWCWSPRGFPEGSWSSVYTGTQKKTDSTLAAARREELASETEGEQARVKASFFRIL